MGQVTLYIDGELGLTEMYERISHYQWLGHQIKDKKTKVFVETIIG